MKVIVDGDIVVYRAGFAAQRTHYELYDRKTKKLVKDFGPGVTRTQAQKELKESGYTMEEFALIEGEPIVSPEAFACNNAKKIMNEILKNTGCDEYELYLTSEDKSNFRFKVASTLPYKGTRKPKGKPIHYKVIREYLINYWNAKVVYNAEADDVILMKHGENTIIASIDKDLTQKPGKYYNIAKKTLKEISPRQAEISYYAQLLLGDKTDNIPGLKTLMSMKLGKETIKKWLKDYDNFPTGNDWFENVLREKARWKVPFEEVERLREEIIPLIRIGYEPDCKDMRIE